MEVTNILKELDLSGYKQNAGLALGKESISTAKALNANMIKDLTAKTGGEMTDVEKEAAAYAALIATSKNPIQNHVDPVDSTSKFQAVKAGGESTIPVVSDNYKMGKETFDGNRLSETIKASIAAAIRSVYIDPASELLFPTVTIDPRYSGLRISVSASTLQDEITREISDYRGKDFGEVSLVKAMDDAYAFGVNNNVLIPVYDAAENAEVFETALEKEVVRRGEVIKTAPILASEKPVDIVSISQSASQIARRNKTHRDTLGNIALERGYVKIDEATQLPIDFGNFDLSYTGNEGSGESKTGNLTFISNIVAWNTGKTENAVDGKVVSAAGGVFDGLVNLSIEISVTILSSVDMTKGLVVFPKNKINLVSVRDEKGLPLSLTDGDGKTIADALEGKEITSADFKATETNSNLADLGSIVSIRSIEKVYMAPYRSGLTVQRPEIQDEQIDDDRTIYGGNIDAAILGSSTAAIETVVSFFNHARNAAGVSASGINYDQPATLYIDPFTKEYTLDMIEALDSQKSSEKTVDVAGVFESYIGNVVDELTAASGYTRAHSILNPKEQVVVKVVASPAIARHISKISIGGNYKVVCAESTSRLLNGQMIVALGTENPVKKDSKGMPMVDILNFGMRVYAPTPVGEITTGSNETYRATHSTPRYGHYVLCPVGARVNVTNMVDAISNKTPQYFKDVE